MFLTVLILSICGVVGAFLGYIEGDAIDQTVLADSPLKGIGSITYTTGGFIAGEIVGSLLTFLI